MISLETSEIDFSIGGRKVTLEVFATYRKIEEFGRQYEDAEQEQLVDDVQIWMKQEHGVQLDQGQALQLINFVTMAFASFKKKHLAEVQSLFGTTSTPANGQNGWWRRTWTTCRSIWPGGKSNGGKLPVS